MKTMRYFNFILILAITGLMYSCYPKGAEYVDELDSYISKYDPNLFRPDTFAMPDQIVYYEDGKIVEDHSHQYDQDILDKFKNSLLSKGFTYTDGKDTSLLVSVTAYETTNGGYIYPPDWGYWDPFYPGYPGGWYPWYPWYPGGWYPWYPSYYTFQTGTLIFRIADTDDVDPTDPDSVKVPIIYLGVIDGLLQGSDSYLLDRINYGIEQLFKQAPFDK